MCKQLAAAGGRRDAITASSTDAGLADAASSAAACAACAPAPTSSAATLDYFNKYVLPAMSPSLERPPAEDWWIEPAAPNKTVGEYRDKVAAYLKSDAFKQRSKELTESVRGHAHAHAHRLVVGCGGRGGGGACAAQRKRPGWARAARPPGLPPRPPPLRPQSRPVLSRPGQYTAPLPLRAPPARGLPFQHDH